LPRPSNCSGDSRGSRRIRGSAIAQQPVQELPHPVAAQRRVRADRHALAQLELRDRLAGLGDLRLLAGDRGQVADRAVDQLASRAASPTPMFTTTLTMPRHLHDVRVAELLRRGRRDLLAGSAS
jgi:hypothetical protein